MIKKRCISPAIVCFIPHVLAKEKEMPSSVPLLAGNCSSASWNGSSVREGPPVEFDRKQDYPLPGILGFWANHFLLSCNSQKLSPLALLAWVSGSCSPRTPDFPKVSNHCTNAISSKQWDWRGVHILSQVDICGMKQTMVVDGHLFCLLLSSLPVPEIFLVNSRWLLDWKFENLKKINYF